MSTFDVTLWSLAMVTVCILALMLHIPTALIAIWRREWSTLMSIGRLYAIRVTWRRLARELGLVTKDHIPLSSRISDPWQSGETKRRVKTPRIRLRADRYGVQVTMRTTPGVSLLEVQSSTRYLADAWRASRVSATPLRPGWVKIRAVRKDPLTAPYEVTSVPQEPDTLESVVIGTDEWADPVRLRLKGVSGIAVAGLPGYGKTSFISGLLTSLAPHPHTQFVILDGKTDDPYTGDYGSCGGRVAALLGDDLAQANECLGILVEARKSRSRTIKQALGTTNIWNTHFTDDWPLIIVVIDEAHTYFSQVKDGGNKALKERNSQASQNVMLVEDLIKKGRSVGIITIVATQKVTGDAIPTQIRDVCSVSLCFAVRTAESAKAALGDDIKEWPDSSPILLQDPAYIGVCVMQLEGRPGYVRVRTPYVSDEILTQTMTSSEQLCLAAIASMRAQLAIAA